MKSNNEIKRRRTDDEMCAEIGSCYNAHAEEFTGLLLWKNKTVQTNWNPGGKPAKIDAVIQKTLSDMHTSLNIEAQLSCKLTCMPLFKISG